MTLPDRDDLDFGLVSSGELESSFVPEESAPYWMEDAMRVAGFLFGSFMMLLSVMSASAVDLKSTRIASGLSSPVLAVSPPGDMSRLFIVEQSGRIRILDGGSLRPEPFLDISDRVRSGGERGLLGLAFHPDYATNRYFYVDYTNQSGATVIARFQTTADPALADEDSEFLILQFSQPYSNHNGGMVAFGPEGYLYIGTGDGGALGDPGNRAQNGSTLLGKMLRIDIDGGTPYAIPEDNPYVDANPLDELWAIGLRNPWRFSFDRLTGDLYIGDVGQDRWEEISFQAREAEPPINYGWRLKEADHCYLPPFGCDSPDLTGPIFEYAHGGNPNSCSVTGGYVYRGPTMPDLSGTYFFADYCSGKVTTFVYEGGGVTELQERTEELEPGGGAVLDAISGFGEDGSGELYICDLNGGELYRISRDIGTDVPGLVGGDPVTIQISGATPGANIFVLYSLAGEGSVYVPQLGIHTELSRPALAGTTTADASGAATYVQVVPEGAVGRNVWLQVLQSGGSSSAVARTVQ